MTLTVGQLRHMIKDLHDDTRIVNNIKLKSKSSTINCDDLSPTIEITDNFLINELVITGTCDID